MLVRSIVPPSCRYGNTSMSGQDFTLHIASICPSERQNFRVTLIDYLAVQFPGVNAGEHLTTANKAIALAQADIVNAFIKHKAAAKWLSLALRRLA